MSNLPQDFSTYYKSLSNTELLDILENPDDYQSRAVEAARAELQNRGLSAEELEEARKPLILQQEKLAKRKEQEKLIREKIKAKSDSVFETLNPVQSGIPTTEKIVRFIVICLGGFYLFGLFKNFRETLFTVRDLPNLGLPGLLFIIELLYLPVSLYFFWKKKKAGWYMLASYCVFTAVGLAWFYIDFYLFIAGDEGDFLGQFLPRPNLMNYLIQFIVYAGILWGISGIKMRNLFNVRKNEIWSTVIITTILTICFLLTI